MTDSTTANLVAVLTTEPVPVPGAPTTGAGLRAWGIAEGLRAGGLDVTLISACGRRDPSPDHPHVIFAARSEIASLLDRLRPGVVVLQHWGIARDVPDLAVPMAIDLAGPHLLERLFWGHADVDLCFGEKIAALRRADFLCCSGEYQRHYFYPFLAMAGYDLRTAALPVIPFSVPPGAPPPRDPSPRSHGPRFVYGGAFLAWQDPAAPIRWLLEEMDAAASGELHFYGGSHPVADASGGRFADLVGLLKAHPRVTMHGFVPFDNLLHEYRQYDAALDLMRWNPERELAYTTRTMIYLHAGLPVIHDNYSELSQFIRNHDCGWTLDPADEQSFRMLARRILMQEVALAGFAARAEAAAALQSWDRTVGPLAAFCHSPFVREGKDAAELSAIARNMELEHLRVRAGQACSELARIRGSMLFRLRAQLPRLAALAAPLAWMASWPLCAALWLRLRHQCPAAHRQHRGKSA